MSVAGFTRAIALAFVIPGDPTPLFLMVGTDAVHQL